MRLNARFWPAAAGWGSMTEDSPLRTGPDPKAKLGLSVTCRSKPAEAAVHCADPVFPTAKPMPYSTNRRQSLLASTRAPDWALCG